MPDLKENGPEKVEKWKLSPELKKFLKVYKNLHKMGEQLKIQLIKQANATKTLSDAVTAVEQRKEAFLKMAPKQQSKPEGHPERQPDFTIRY